MAIHINVRIPLTATVDGRKPGKGNPGEQGEWGLVENNGTPQVRDTAPSGKLGSLLEKLQGAYGNVSFVVTDIHERVGTIILADISTMDDAQKKAVVEIVRGSRLQIMNATIVRTQQ